MVTTLARTRQQAAAEVSRHPAWTLVLASLGVFMTALDTLVVTTALPVLRVSLHAGLPGLEWTVNAYNLVFACFLLTGAVLSDRLGRRRMFTLGILAFTTASAAAALSGSIGSLIAARAVQGAGAAVVMPLSLTLVSQAFPAHKRGAAIGLWGGIVGLAVAAGPVVGGAVTSGLNWHWIFWLNVPVGALLIPAAARRLAESHGPASRLDLPGLALASAAAFGLTYGLVRAGTAGFTNATVIGSLAGGLALTVAFIRWQRRTAHPMIPPVLFRSRAFTAANTVSFLMYAGLFGVLFLMSQLLQTGMGYTPLQAGLRLLPWTLPPLFIAPLAGTLADKYGSRPFMALGLALQAAGYAWVATIASPATGYLPLGLAFGIAGIGTSFCFPTVANAIMGSVPFEQAGVASGINSALRELGGVSGVAVLASVFASHGGYGAPHAFVAGFVPAAWTGVGLSAAGIIAALLTRGKNC